MKSVTDRENRVGKNSETKENVSLENSQRFNLAGVCYPEERQEMKMVT